MKNKENNVVRPSHYNQGGIEVIDILKAKLSKEEFAGLCKGSAIQYIMRAPFKNGVEDYKKAVVYMNWLIESEESNETC